ncbi:MAG: TIR domain-containing protein [Pseudonocardiaceae bacterium]
MARVFLSYAREDLALAREVHRWLVEAGHEVFLDQNPRDGIALGEQWRHRLNERLRWADALVCVVTSAAVASSWCSAEIATAQARGSRLLPLLAEPGLTHPLLTEVQHTDMTQNPASARAALVTALRRIDAAGGSGWPDDRSPFPGLRPFESDRHRVFFGRAEEIKQLAGRVRSAAEGVVTLVVGPSGCGKSSLVRAGLVPVMATEPSWRVLPPILPGADPMGALARELAAAARPTGLGWTVEHVHHQLAENGLAGLADQLLLANPDGPQRRLLLVVDQVEELLTQAAPGQRARLAELLRPALTGPVRVVGTLRPEFLDQWLADPDLASVATEVYPLRPLHREALRLVIEGPAQLAGINVEAHLVARLIDDTDTGEALPLLAFTLAQLAEGVGRGGQLSAARYDQLGGVQGTLTRQADAALAAAVATGGRSPEEVIAGLLRLVTVDEQGRPTRWRVRRDELPAPVVAELDAFVARRLLTTDTDNGAVVIGVAHEAFLSAWPPLAEAITANVTALRARRAVEHAATEWHNHARPPSRLWGDGQLAATLADTGARIHPGSTPPSRQRLSRWLPRRHRVLVTDQVDLTPQAHDFLHASIRRDSRRRRRTTTVLLVLLILTLAAAGFAVTRQRIAEQGQRLATAHQLVGQAEAARSTDRRAALLLGLAAYRIHPDGETHSSLLNTLTAGPYADELTGHSGQVSSMAFAPNGHTLATGSDDKTVILWELTDPTRPHQLGQPLPGHATVNSVAFSPDGHTLATGNADGTMILWELTDPTRPHQLGQPLPGHTAVNSVAFSPDGHTLATGNADGTVILWELTDPARPHPLGIPLTGHTSPVNSVTWTPDGATLVTGSVDHTVILWDLTDRAQPRRLGSPLNSGTGPVAAMALASDGHTLATGGLSIDRTLTLWDLTDRAHPRQLGSGQDNSAGGITHLTFAPGGNILAASDGFGRTTLWDVTDRAQPQPLGPPLTGLGSQVSAVAFAPDGRTLVTGSDYGTAILWDLTHPVQPQRLGPLLAAHHGSVWSMAFSPDGHTLATGSWDKTVILWNLTHPAQPQRLGPPLTSHRDLVLSVAFSPNGHILATSSLDKTVILWDLTDPTRPRQLGPPLTLGHTMFSVAFSPDGRTLATSSGDKTVILWNLTDPTRPHQLGHPLTGQTDSVVSMAFSPDGHILATGSNDASVILRDLTNPAHPHQLGPILTGHTGQVRSVAFSPDGHTLATGSFDGTAILWDLTDPTHPHRLDPPLTTTTGVGDTNHGVFSVAFSPDGRTLAVGGYGTILWDLTDPAQPRRLGPPLTNNHPVSFAMFSPDRRTLAVGNIDGTMILWDLTHLSQVRDHVVERACSATQGGLNHAEWAHYIPDLPYQNTCPA